MKFGVELDVRHDWSPGYWVPLWLGSGIAVEVKWAPWAFENLRGVYMAW